MVFRRRRRGSPPRPPVSRRPSVEPLESRLAPATIKVTTVTDDFTPNDGGVSLREAIIAINSGNDLGDPDITAQSPGTFGVNDTIQFAIPGTGLHTINVGQPAQSGGTGLGGLPGLSKPVTINGYTQPGAAANTLANADNAKIMIELRGGAAGTGGDGLMLGTGSGGSVVKGLAIDGFGANGIHVTTNGNLIVGNFVGTNAAGTAMNANLGDGILIDGASNNVIGGTSPADRNLASGNQVGGIHVLGTTATPATGNVIRGNFVGVDATGKGGVGRRAGFGSQFSGTVQGNFAFGIEISGGNNNTVGGTTPAARNVVGLNLDGISLDDGAQGNVVQGNSVGVGADGASLVPNQLHGIVLRSSGGTLTPPLGPGQANEPGVRNNMIGGTAKGAGNLIAFNGAAGVAVFGNPLPTGAAAPVPQSLWNTGNSILGNSIFNNGLRSPGTDIGIDLVTKTTFPDDDGATPNSPTPHNAGTNFTPPNLLENKPVLTSITLAPGQTIIKGTLNSLPNAGPFRIELFVNPAGSTGTRAQGAAFLGTVTIPTTDAAGNASFTFTLKSLLSSGQVVTATATDPSDNTSEFSAGLTFTIPPPNSVSTAFGPNGQVLLVVSATGQLREIDSTGARVLAHGVRSASVAYGPGGQQVLEIVSLDGTLRQFDSAGVHVLGGGILSASVAFGPTGLVLALVSMNGTLTQYDSGGAHVLGGGVRTASVAFGKYGEALAVVSTNGTLTLFDAFGARVLRQGVLAAGLTFVPGGSAIVDALLADGTLLQFDATGQHSLGKVS